MKKVLLILYLLSFTGCRICTKHLRRVDHMHSPINFSIKHMGILLIEFKNFPITKDKNNYILKCEKVWKKRLLGLSPFGGITNNKAGKK